MDYNSHCYALQIEPLAKVYGEYNSQLHLGVVRAGGLLNF